MDNLKMDGINLEEKRYLWLNFSEQTGQHLYCYLDREGNKIYGNIVTNTDTESPYSNVSIHKGAECKGEAVHFVSSHKHESLKQ